MRGKRKYRLLKLNSLRLEASIIANEEGWHLSKSVPATLLLGLITQAAAIVWTVSMMMADIQQNTEKLIGFSERVSKVESMVQSQAVSMARIDENIKAIRNSVEQMAQRP